MKAIILCGGSGTRLWPESRKNLPKQFIPIFDHKSLLDLTVERILSIKLKQKPIFISNKQHGFLVKKTLEKYNLDADILLEPEGKNTCAAIYLAAKHCSHNDNLLVMPSDHLIPNKKKFSADILEIEKNLTPNQWITLGIKPTKPSEAYGYIKVVKKKNKNTYKVIKFTEKPNKKIANQFIRDDSYFWNAGIFIANTKMILNSIKQHAPIIANKCDLTYDQIQVNEGKNELNFNVSLFSQIPSESIDYAVMEYEKNIFLYPFNSEWNDVGSWDAVSEIDTEKLVNNNVIQIKCRNNYIRNNKRIIATIGVKDLIIVENDNAILISKKNNTEDVKKVVDKLLKIGFSEANEHSFENRPWGKFETLLDNEHCKVKKIIVDPKKRLSLQYHNFRSEHWLIVSGTANIYLDGKNMILTSGQSVDIPLKSHHYIENKENESLIIIETQLGSYFGEDDIVRLDDPYSR